MLNIHETTFDFCYGEWLKSSNNYFSVFMEEIKIVSTLWNLIVVLLLTYLYIILNLKFSKSFEVLLLSICDICFLGTFSIIIENVNSKCYVQLPQRVWSVHFTIHEIT